MNYEFTSFINEESVMVLRGATKLEIMDELITRAAELTKLSRDMIYRMTWKREQMMTTGVGNGLALPHIRVNDIPQAIVIVGVTETPIADYQSQDDQPVRVVVFTVAPDENPEAYLQLLGSVSRKLRNPELLAKLTEGQPNEANILKTLMECAE